MAFSCKRGRPHLHRQKKDTGTAELAARHAKGFTMEPLDICLKRNLISEEQHAAGMHLRWLHSLRFGAPTVRAYDHSDMGGRSIAVRDETWRAGRESEYEQSIRLLKTDGLHIMVTNTVIFNHFPRFLLPSRIGHNAESASEVYNKELSLLQEGLTLLHSVFWVQKRQKSG